MFRNTKVPTMLTGITMPTTSAPRANQNPDTRMRMPVITKYHGETHDASTAETIIHGITSSVLSSKCRNSINTAMVSAPPTKILSFTRSMAE
jgi:hypothetical protein